MRSNRTLADPQALASERRAPLSLSALCALMTPLCLSATLYAEPGTAETEEQLIKPAQVQPPLTPALAYQSFFEGEQEDDLELFAEGFLRVVSPQKLDEVRRLYREQLGAFIRVKTVEGEVFNLEFERGSAPSKLSIYEGRVSSLWFGAPMPSVDQRELLRQRLKAVEGVSAALIRFNQREVLFEHNAHLPLSVGSAFKLYVLKALLVEVEAGRRELSEVVRLSEAGRSLPSGILQDWPLGTPVTLATLATLMISQSDNSATDHLILALGRETIERHAPKGMQPFLTTREAFSLKWGPQPDLKAQYEDASVSERRGLLKQLSDIPLKEIKPRPNPTAIQEVEWRASAVELCDVLWALRERELLNINTGLVTLEASPWDRVAFKGGSEPGVLNYSHLLLAWGSSPTGSKRPIEESSACVIATINHPTRQIDPAFGELASGLIAQATQALLARRAEQPPAADSASIAKPTEEAEGAQAPHPTQGAEPSSGDEEPQTREADQEGEQGGAEQGGEQGGAEQGGEQDETKDKPGGGSAMGAHEGLPPESL